MSDAPTLVTVALAAVGLGASTLKFAQYALRRNGNGNGKTVGRMHTEALERMLEEVARFNTNEKIMPILTELKTIGEKQVEALQNLNLVLVELKTIMRMRRVSD